MTWTSIWIINLVKKQGIPVFWNQTLRSLVTDHEHSTMTATSSCDTAGSIYVTTQHRSERHDIAEETSKLLKSVLMNDYTRT